MQIKQFVLNGEFHEYFVIKNGDEPISNLSAEQREQLVKTNRYAKSSVGKPKDAAPGFGKLRLFMAFLFFFTVFVLDKTNLSIAGITAEKIQTVISADYEQTLDVWIQKLFSYNSPSR